jgi:DNA repair protein RadB
MGEKVSTISATNIRIPIDCEPFDSILNGGIETGSITEFYGEAGTGKTNICLQVAKNITKSGKKVIYVDTEGVSPERLNQIFGANSSNLAKEIIFYSPHDIEEQAAAVDNVVQLSHTSLEIGSIILDSATVHYRYGFGSDVELDGRRSLSHQITKLLAIARRKDIPIIITAQVYTDVVKKKIEPLGGHILHHAAKTIIKLEKIGKGIRRATIVKHRSIPEDLSADFIITEHGIEGCKKT